MTLDVQLLTMLTMIAGGFYLGLALDTYRRLAGSWQRRQLMYYVTELAFWLTQTLLLFYVLFLVNNGEIRVYILLAVLLGYSTYRALAAPLYKRMLERLLTIIYRVIHIIWRAIQILILTPLTALLRLIYVLALFLFNVLWTILSVVLKVIFWPLKLIGNLLYQVLPAQAQNFLHTVTGFYSTIENIVIRRMKHILDKWRS